MESGLTGTGKYNGALDTYGAMGILNAIFLSCLVAYPLKCFTVPTWSLLHRSPDLGKDEGRSNFRLSLYPTAWGGWRRYGSWR